MCLSIQYLTIISSMTPCSNVILNESNIIDKRILCQERKDIKPGKKVSHEFEDEVLLHCENNNIEIKKNHHHHHHL